MKILYISSFHGTLEYDDLSLFTELGIDWFSTGLFMDPKNPRTTHASRKNINHSVDEGLIREFKSLNPQYDLYKPVYVNKNIVDQFDIVLASHCCPYPLYLQDNWEAIKHKPVVWRTYCQQGSRVEAATQEFRKKGLKIIRVSPKERTIPNYAGDDAIIRCYIDENEYKDWTGEDNVVLTFNNMFTKRTYHSNTPQYLSIKSQFKNFELYGCDNEDAPLSRGYLDWEKQKEKYRKSRVYFGLGSKPAACTYNLIEAMMTGCPVVTWGPMLGSMLAVPDWAKTYEVPDIIRPGVDGFWSDSEQVLVTYIKKLLNDKDLAKKISVSGRERAISIFGKEKVKRDWSDFLNSLL